MSDVVNGLPIGKSGYEGADGTKSKADGSVAAGQTLGMQVPSNHPHAQLQLPQQQLQPQLGQQMSLQQYGSRQPQPISSSYLNYYNNGYHPPTYQYNYAPFSYYGGVAAGQVAANSGAGAPNASGASVVGGMTAVPASDASYLQMQQMHQQQAQQQALQQQQSQGQGQQQQQPPQTQAHNPHPQQQQTQHSLQTPTQLAPVNDYQVQQFASFNAGSTPPGSNDKKALRTKPLSKQDSGSPSGSSSGRPYTCEYPDCQWSFARQSDLRRHAKSHAAPMFHCPYWRNDPTCHRNGGAFNRLDVLKRHLRLVHYVQDKHQSGTTSSRTNAGKDDAGWCRACQRMFPLSKAFVDHCMACAQLISPAEWKSLSSRYPYEQMGMMQYQLQQAQQGAHPGSAQAAQTLAPIQGQQQRQGQPAMQRGGSMVELPGDFLIDKDIKTYGMDSKKRGIQAAGGSSKKTKSG